MLFIGVDLKRSLSRSLVNRAPTQGLKSWEADLVPNKMLKLNLYALARGLITGPTRSAFSDRPPGGPLTPDHWQGLRGSYPQETEYTHSGGVTEIKP